MNDQKMDNLLNLAIDATPAEREKSLALDVGYEPRGRLWDVIIKYSGDITVLKEAAVSVVPLLNGYAVVTLPQEALNSLTDLPQIEYVEKPKRLFFAVNQGKAASCIFPVQEAPYNLTGRGVLVGIADSGVDYRHPDFRSGDGSSRILRLWDQSAQGNPPAGYAMGAEYTKEQIDQALEAPPEEGRILVPSRDLSGHGTEVLGIAAGNGRASDTAYRGVAWESPILAVKLGQPREGSFPRTTELIQGVDYLVRQAIALQMPMAVNISFGNNYGSHEGDTLLETYLNDVSGLGRTVICVGTGNEGRDALHTSGVLTPGSEALIELGVGQYEPSLNVQLWKYYVDRFQIYLITPSGEQIGPFYEQLGPQRYAAGQTRLLVYYGEPSPYSQSQEIYIDFIPTGSYVETGIWKIRLVPQEIVEGRYDLYLPGGGVLNTATRFYRPTPVTTLTIPSAASKVITVGAYDSHTQSYADFSGRGFTRVTNQVKPDLAAPGVNIRTTKAGGGYTEVTGTSFATPFVTGSAALLMQWGITDGNDPYLYGEKVKAYLRRGARQLPGYDVWPNEYLGYGALCVRDSLPG